MICNTIMVMKSEGGSDDPSNLITLCTACHYKIHQRQVSGTYNHSQRRLKGIARAKATGVRFGRPRKLTAHQRDEALQRIAAGETQANIAGCSTSVRPPSADWRQQALSGTAWPACVRVSVMFCRKWLQNITLNRIC